MSVGPSPEPREPIEVGELESGVVSGSITGGLVPDQDSPNDMYRYDYICVDAGVIDISYSASSPRFSYSTSAVINCEPCIPDGLYEAGYVNNGLMVLAPGAFLLLGVIVWVQRAIMGQVEE